MFRFVFRAVVPLVLAIALTSCSRPPPLVGIDNADKPVASVPTATKRKVFIVTTRAASEVTGVFYSGERAPELGLAAVTVSIPPVHVEGQLERPKRLPPDPETEFAIIDPLVYRAEHAFISAVNGELATRAPRNRDILFFVHGYNNTTSDAILRIAQFAEDTDFEGVPVLFTWASAAQVTRYVYDLNSALIARPRLLQAGTLLQRTNTNGVSVFAHSMGAFLTVEAITQAHLAGRYNRGSRLDNVMLAAPDIDIDLFRSQVDILPPSARNFFIFTSRDDKALGFSRRISGGVQKVGAADASELAGLGVTVIDLSQVEDSASGTHSKFAGSPEVVRLIGESLQEQNYRSPGRTQTLYEVLDGVPVVNIFTQ